MLNRNHETWMKMYEKRLLRTIKEKVLIRDILVTQDRLDERENRVGEFHSSFAADESEDAFAKRMLLHINKMALIAADIHHSDNFTATEERHYAGATSAAQTRPPIVNNPHRDKAEEKETATRATKNTIPQIMKAACKNNVTRPSFNEYYFYPSKNADHYRYLHSNISSSKLKSWHPNCLKI
jgi:hypothetical protein